MSKGTILLVEDNLEILKANAFMLEWEGYTVRCAENVEQARAHIKGGMPDLLVLDIMLPDGSGLAFCEEVRRRREDVSILFLTALGKSSDIIMGLRTGGDDYLAKPYEYDVLLARIEALLRRSLAKRQVMERGPLRLELPAMRAYVNGRDALLTQKEFLILLTLVRREDESISPEELYRIAWGGDAAGDTRAVRPQVSRLRGKLELHGGLPFTIATEYGRGYVFRMK